MHWLLLLLIYNLIFENYFLNVANYFLKYPARSEGGEVKSRKAHANAETLVEYKTTQQQRPRFLKMPMDQEVVEGKDLLLNCSASGPSTTITWYYNEKPIDFSAPNNEVRLHGRVTT